MHLKTSKQKKSPSSLKREEFIFCENEVHSFFEKNKALFFPESFIVLQGSLGAGKSAFVRAFLSFLGIEKNYQGSPTYPLVHSYRKDKISLIHCDVYRLKSLEEFEATGLEEALMPENEKIVFCEWLDKFTDIKNNLLISAQKKKIPALVIQIDFLENNLDKRSYKIAFF